MTPKLHDCILFELFKLKRYHLRVAYVVRHLRIKALRTRSSSTCYVDQNLLRLSTVPTHSIHGFVRLPQGCRLRSYRCPNMEARNPLRRKILAMKIHLAKLWIMDYEILEDIGQILVPQHTSNKKAPKANLKIIIPK